ncbi:O-linked GlcNAc transferase [Solibacillus sp. FSL H8-0538]|uniref:O-linked GlcNAc transferase n=1 Tax=Solibacillus sp. FSL H8-0538 TaxID=2921400 RepID=UPI0030F9B306
MTDMETYFYNGQFHACYKLATQLKEDMQQGEVACRFIELFSQYQYEKIPTYTTCEHKQSEEREDETYAELDEVETIRAIKGEAEFGEAIKQLEIDAIEGSNERKAQSLFVQGQLFLLAHHYDESIHCFMQAVIYNPNHGLYYGYAAQTMHRFSWSPFEVMGYLERAIELNPQNARWHWNKGLVLTQLYKDLQQEAFLENALIALEQALTSCRPVQKSLKGAIENTIENMRDYVFN